MKNDFELVSKYNDISTSEKPKIPNYHGDMFIDVEQEYLMRKDLQQRIDKAIELLESLIELNGTMTTKGMYKLLNILKGE